MIEIDIDINDYYDSNDDGDWFIYMHTVRAKKNCRRAAECGRPLRAANRRLPSLVRNGDERQGPVIFTPRATLGPMLQTVMDPGTNLLVISCSSHRSPPQGWRTATPSEVCSCIHCAHCIPAGLSRLSQETNGLIMQWSWNNNLQWLNSETTSGC